MSAPTTRSRLAGLLLLAFAIVTVFVLISLGNWQLRRLAWKQELISAIETRAYGDALPAPGAEDYDPDRYAYQKVEIEGTYLHANSMRVKALTELGAGYWVMTPLGGPEGVTWINRGFVPTDHASPSGWSTPLPAKPVTGILRVSEPNGTLLERNDPEADRWVSRDVEALSQSAGLPLARPYFIDVSADESATGWPRGGMTKLKFRNTHLSYALTWYAMAALLVGALVFVVRGRYHRDEKSDQF